MPNARMLQHTATQNIFDLTHYIYKKIFDMTHLAP